MSTQAAFSFIRKVRIQDEALRDQVRALGQDAGLESVVQIGAEAGFNFTTEELRAAYKHDWAMRMIRYCPQTEA